MGNKQKQSRRCLIIFVYTKYPWDPVEGRWGEGWDPLAPPEKHPRHLKSREEDLGEHHGGEEEVPTTSSVDGPQTSKAG